MSNTITSPVFVCRDNIDTDVIIPAQYPRHVQ
jgi:3-isopropylmalate dehydratase small subunit